MEVYSGDKTYIFVSYAHADAKIVVPIIDRLQYLGFRLWYDKGIEAGTEWPQNIAEHIANSACVMVFMSPNSSESRNCRNEINLAAELKKEMFIVHLEEFELPLGLRLQLNLSQAIYKTRFLCEDDFYRELTSANIIQVYRGIANNDIGITETKNIKKKAAIKEGLYNIRNAYSGLLLNVFAGRDRDGTKVTVWKKDNSSDQEFYIYANDDGLYLLKYAISSQGRVVDVNRGQTIANPIEKGCVIDIWCSDDLEAQLFNIIDCGQGEYIFELASKPGHIISPPGKTSSEINGTQLILEIYKGEKYQRWNVNKM